MNEERDNYSYVVIGHAMAVHRELGPGLDEIFYHECLAAKLKSAGIPYQFKPSGRLLHRGLVADNFEADLIVGDELVLELKVLWGDFAPDHLTQILCYLKYWRLRAGLLLDFGKESLIQKRAVFTESLRIFEVDNLLKEAPTFVTSRELLGVIGSSVSRVLLEHGLGYRDTTYRGLLDADFKVEGVPHILDPFAAVKVGGVTVGETKLPCIVISQDCAILVVALRDSRTAADRAVLQTCLKHLQLPWGLVVNFGKQSLDYHFVARPRG